jgi:hypothetical protein
MGSAMQFPRSEMTTEEENRSISLAGRVVIFKTEDGMVLDQSFDIIPVQERKPGGFDNKPAQISERFLYNGFFFLFWQFWKGYIEIGEGQISMPAI